MDKQMLDYNIRVRLPIVVGVVVVTYFVTFFCRVWREKHGGLRARAAH